MRVEEFLMERPVFESRDFANALDIGVDSASRMLKSYQKEGFISKITRGVWINPKNTGYSPYGIVPYLLKSEQGYVSFLSALHRYGMISQIPQKIFIATTGHHRRLKSELVEFEFIQLNPTLMKDGIMWFEGAVNYAIATPEKALLDCLYISTRKGRRFAHFPELDFSAFHKTKFLHLLKSHQFPKPIYSAILQRFEALWLKNE